jgi:nucleoside-diphosphate-sugar epimerase
MKFTILGSMGFIGTYLKQYFEANDIEYFAPERGYLFTKDEDLGHVIYAIGLTADFRTRSMDTVKAHVCKLVEILENSSFQSFLYLSATRIYSNLDAGANESAALIVNPNDPSDLYNISKIMGESICLSIPNNTIRVARLSNVLGYDFNSENFLFALLSEIKNTGSLRLRSALESQKDYISINDVVKLLYKISLGGEQRLYNLASGKNVSNKEIIDRISSKIKFSFHYEENLPKITFPLIDVSKLKEEFRYIPENIFYQVDNIIENYFKN